MCVLFRYVLYVLGAGPDGFFELIGQQEEVFELDLSAEGLTALRDFDLFQQLIYLQFGLFLSRVVDVAEDDKVFDEAEEAEFVVREQLGLGVGVIDAKGDFGDAVR
jgi:hypothetical protein